MKPGDVLNPDRPIYQLTVQDLISVIEESTMDIELTNYLVMNVEKRIGNYIDWSEALLFAIFDFKENQEIRK